ncbi:hypothetical protein HN018_28125 (plasmid) [Lichenicola cladoniae]|uniref:Type IV secretion system protein VirB10 n=1 Tax=Lichenicola cladoniae TaxID=1484109 RepID=A0A6M8HZJ4_9PROT|nr:type IV secretion system protein VirB10 [Lichenicola cladoniae]NPD70337.1 hypothetical protein [Acetobacteraceae bacterium]QKE93994.1 hypothetical protein HN018_28125 [Lichenicola cladoniae]
MSGDLPQNPAGPPQAPPPGATILPGERHVSDVAGRSSFSRKQGAIMLGCATGAAVAFILLRPAHKHVDPNAISADRLQVRQVTRYEPALPPPSVVPATYSLPRPVVLAPALPVTTGPAAPSFMQQLGNNKQPVDPLAKARHAGLFVYTGGGAGGAGGGTIGGPEEGNGAARLRGTGPNELAAKLQATPITSVTASVLQHQPYLLTEGTVIGCVLQTAMDSTLPGFTTCIIPQDVIGKSGITLLDRGTKIVGEFHGGMTQGQDRLFVLWTRAETPSGVIINLDSPAADPLGRSGFDGTVDNHFWQRFGGALMLSLVEGGIQAGVAAVSPSGSNYINTGNVSSVASTSLDNSINIRPTLRKNQGELVSIFVARDLDFSTVYQVAATYLAPTDLTGAVR